MTTIHAQAERKRQDRSVCRAEKRLCRARMLRVRGLIHPTSAVCATTDTARGEKRLPSEQNQATLKSSGRTLGECRVGMIHAILKRHGFVRAEEGPIGPSATVARQEYWKAEIAGSYLALDLHWSLINTWTLADILPIQDVLASAQPLPGLSPDARRIATEAALYHACIHRAFHVQSPYHVGGRSYYGGDRLIWLYDMHLLVPHLTPEDWLRFIDRCRRDDTGDLCLEALENTADLLGSAVPSDVLASLITLPKTGSASGHLLRGSPIRRFLSDLVHVPGLTGKLGLIRMLVLPPEGFMRARYPEYASWPLWALYPLRVIIKLRNRK